MGGWIEGNDSKSATLVDNRDTIYASHINQLRQSFPVSAIIGRSLYAQYPCDGIKDDIQIIEALNIVNNAGGGIVFLKSGIYYITTTLTIGSNTILQGEGNSTILFLINGANINVIKSKSTATTGIILRDFAIDGNKTNQSAGSGQNHNIYLSNVTKSIVENVNSHDALKRGINMETCTYSEVRNNWLIDNGWTGCEFNLESDYSSLVNNIVSGNGHSGLSVDSSDWFIIKGNHCKSNVFEGINLQPTAPLTMINRCIISDNLCHQNSQNGILTGGLIWGIISNNHCNSNSFQGINLSSSNTCVVSGNSSDANTRDGIKILNANHNNIVGNNCAANDTGLSHTFDGITIEGNSRGNLIQNNRCRNNNRYEINIDADTVIDTLVTGNHVAIYGSDSHVGSLNDAGTRTYKSNNWLTAGILPTIDA